MKVLVIVATILTVSQAANLIDFGQKEWSAFKEAYGKSYDDEQQEKERMDIFISNLKGIYEHNKLFDQGLVTYQMAVNKFTDLTHKEFLDTVVGPVPATLIDFGLTEWIAFKEAYGKSYDNEQQEKERMDIFISNLKGIYEHNKLFDQGLATYQMAVNKFTDLTHKEFLDTVVRPVQKSVAATLIDFGLTEWIAFKETYGKSYDNEQQEKERMDIFISNLKGIYEHNKLFDQGLVTYQMAVNKFTDLTHKEFLDTVVRPVQKSVAATFIDFGLTEWIAFKEAYGKSYDDEQQEKERMDIFISNLKGIYEHNKLFDQGLATYQMAVNKFTDLTHKEFLDTVVRPVQKSVAATLIDFGLTEWIAFKEAYGKSYDNEQQEKERMDIFISNLKGIYEHNKLFDQGLVTYQMAVNKFSDLTHKEFLDTVVRPVQKSVAATLIDFGLTEWIAFKEAYGKSYDDEQQEKERMDIFISNLKGIYEHNKLFDQGLVTYQMAVNKFTDLTHKEFLDTVVRPVQKSVDATLIDFGLTEWIAFKEAYGKSYDNEQQEKERMNIFKSNLKGIYEHNKLFDQGLVTYQMAVNKFTDLTHQEFLDTVVRPVQKSVAATLIDFGLTEWIAFKEAYGKSYDNEQQEKERMDIFISNLKGIYEHNKLFDQGLVTYQMAVNKFSDLTHKEFLDTVVRPVQKSVAATLIDFGLTEWIAFKEAYGKSYDDEQQEKERMDIFISNLKGIYEHNKLFDQGLVTYQMAVNKFTDLTHKEFLDTVVRPVQKSVDATLIDFGLTEWIAFKEAYGKSYDNEQQEKERMDIFISNLKGIYEHNKLFDQGLVTYQMAVNKFTDLTHKEFLDTVVLPVQKSVAATLIDFGLTEWIAFKEAYGKSYDNEQQEKERMDIFISNLKGIYEHNKLFDQGLVTYQMAVNKFTDLTHKEFLDTVVRPVQKSVAATLIDFGQTEWIAFKEAYAKSYDNELQEKERMEIFISNLKSIYEHNKLFEQGLVTYEMGVNKFTDLTHKEFLDTMVGPVDRSINIENMPQGRQFNEPRNVVIPNEIDWRKLGAVTPVKDQQHCGSCWAFSSTGSLEGQYFMKTGKLVSLSEQNLVDCSNGQYGNNGCNWGWLENAFFYVHKNGINTEEAYPYEDRLGECHYDEKTSVTKVRDFVTIANHNETQLQLAVALVGPISVYIDSANESFQKYKRGVYFEPACSSTVMHHLVLAVGYGTEDGQDYWLVKNSWGLDWGEDGYMKVARNKDNNCGIATGAKYPLV